MAKYLKEKYKGLADGVEDEAAEVVSVAGRVMAKRVMGKLAFLSIRDDRAQIQVSRVWMSSFIDLHAVYYLNISS